jgi:hypothetical protein
LSFNVATFELGKYTEIVRSQQADTGRAHQFSDQNLQIGAQPGLLAEFVGSHEEAKRDVLAALSSLGQVLEASAAELDRTRQMYDRTDQSAAEQLDRTYPDPGGPPKLPPIPGMPTDSGPSAVWPTAFPASRLTEPKKPDDFNNPLQVINDIGNFLSPTWWANKILEATISVNPAQEASKWLSGDWEQFGKAADTMNSLSWFCTDVASDLRTNISNLATTWAGNASNAAYQYFNTLGLRVEDYSAGFAALRDKYLEAARGVWEFSEALCDLIQNIFDNVFWAALAAAAGGALAETVVGPALLWSLAALECKNIADGWRQMTWLLMAIQNTVRMIHGGILDIIGTNGVFKAHPLPAGYRHPGA